MKEMTMVPAVQKDKPPQRKAFQDIQEDTPVAMLFKRLNEAYERLKAQLGYVKDLIRKPNASEAADDFSRQDKPFLRGLRNATFELRQALEVLAYLEFDEIPRSLVTDMKIGLSAEIENLNEARNHLPVQLPLNGTQALGLMRPTVELLEGFLSRLMDTPLIGDTGTSYHTTPTQPV